MGTSEMEPQMGIPVPGIPVPPPPGTTYQYFHPPATVPWSTDIYGCYPDHFGRCKFPKNLDLLSKTFWKVERWGSYMIVLSSFLLSFFCISFWCPCYTFGQLSEIIDRGSSSCGVIGPIYTLLAWVTGCACCYSMVYRMKMRKQFALEGDECQDWIYHCLCEPCALTQEYRELQNRGSMSPWAGLVFKGGRTAEWPWLRSSNQL